MPAKFEITNEIDTSPERLKMSKACLQAAYDAVKDGPVLMDRFTDKLLLAVTGLTEVPSEDYQVDMKFLEVMYTCVDSLIRAQFVLSSADNTTLHLNPHRSGMFLAAIQEFDRFADKFKGHDNAEQKISREQAQAILNGTDYVRAVRAELGGTDPGTDAGTNGTDPVLN